MLILPMKKNQKGLPYIREYEWDRKLVEGETNFCWFSKVKYYL